MGKSKLITKEEYNKAKMILNTAEVLEAKGIVMLYEKQLSKAIEKARPYRTCDHNWVENPASPPYERTFYCTKCDRNVDGYGEEWGGK